MSGSRQPVYLLGVGNNIRQRISRCFNARHVVFVRYVVYKNSHNVDLLNILRFNVTLKYIGKGTVNLQFYRYRGRHCAQSAFETVAQRSANI